MTEWEFTSQDSIQLPLWLVKHPGPVEKISEVELRVLDDTEWAEFQAKMATAFPDRFDPKVEPQQNGLRADRELLDRTPGLAIAYIFPRGTGPTGFPELSSRKKTQLLRRFMLVGETLESGQVWDISRAAGAIRSIPGLAGLPLRLRAQGYMAVNALYASLWSDGVRHLELHNPAESHRKGPIYLNVLRHLDIPTAAALAAERSALTIYSDNVAAWDFPRNVARVLNWGEARVTVHAPEESPSGK